MNHLFDWVPWFHELATRIATANEDDLVARARDVAWKEDGSVPKLLDYGDHNIDPFSFFYTLATGCAGRAGRTRICRSVHQIFQLDASIPPLDVDDAFIFPQGIPLNTLFHQDGAGDPELLWRLFRSFVGGPVSDDRGDFQQALAIGNVGVPKLTQTLFLVNAEAYIPLDESTRDLLPEPAVEVGDWHAYRSALDEARNRFPACAPYEINLVAWLLKSGGIEIQQNAWQVSSHVEGYPGEDHWEEFASSNAVWTGGPGGGVSWADHAEGTSPNRLYPLQEPERGDVVLVRRAGHGLAVGLVYRNLYREGLSEDGRIDVLWLNKTDADLGANWTIQPGFGRAEAIAETFFANDAYHPTLELLQQFGYGQAPVDTRNASPVTREAVQQAILEFDRLGRDRFLTRYGYAPARTHWIIGRDRRYDMKPVWAAAHAHVDGGEPANPRETNTADVRDQLQRLGFVIDAGDEAHYAPAAGAGPRNRILFGPPGTGKTWATVGHALAIVDGSDEIGDHDTTRFSELRFDPDDGSGNIAMVTFHQNFAYEDFVEGIRPVLDEADLRYELTDGLFKRLADHAARHRDQRFVLIIDEINRANIAKVFGELITLLEDSRRLGKAEETVVTLPYSKKDFGVPDNLYLIATMNTADRSIQLLDAALRRRFTFIEVMPDHDHSAIPVDLDGVDCRRLLKVLNERIVVLLDREHQVGHTYFLDIADMAELSRRFREQVFPLLQECFFDDWAKLHAVLGNSSFVSKHARDDLFATTEFADEDVSTYARLPDEDTRWLSPTEYRAIYESGSD